MPVDEPQAAATGQCREDPEQERAIAAEDERPLTALENPTHTGGDRRRGAAHLARCDDARGRLAVAATDVGVGLARIARAQALEQSGGAKRGRPSFLAAPRPRGVDGRVDHGEGRHVRGFCAIWRLPAPRGRRRRYVASRTRSMIRVSARETNRATYRISLRRMEPGIATLPHFARSGSGLVDARLVRGVSYRLAFEGLINKLASVFVHFAGDPGKLPCLEGLESFLDFFIELGGSLVLAPSTRYLVDDVRGVAERGDRGVVSRRRVEPANQSAVLGFVWTADGSHFLGHSGQHRATVGFLENNPDGALRLASFVGSLPSVDEEQVVALPEVINHEQLLTWASLALL